MCVCVINRIPRADRFRIHTYLRLIGCFRPRRVCGRKSPPSCSVRLGQLHLKKSPRASNYWQNNKLRPTRSRPADRPDPSPPDYRAASASIPLVRSLRIPVAVGFFAAHVGIPEKMMAPGARRVSERSGQHLYGMDVWGSR